MPKVDLQYSHGALPAASIGPLTDELTGFLLARRGLPDTPQARASVWWFAREQQAFVAGAAPAQPLVTITFTIFAGGMDAAQVEGLIADGTRAVKALSPEARVWLLVDEVPADRWGVEGRPGRAAAPPARA
jgi:phenylpyruvate tautomerase PptA (4-oxalocrotonate tautomerase family)